jgi:REP element-mobilizing transposase RayT
MARLPRIYSESGFYHIMLRGINREKIFGDSACKKHFMDILGRNFTKSASEKESKKKGQLFAFCILDNHVHLLVKESDLGISNLMQRVSGAYAHYYNRRYGRSGPVFESRYTSKAVEDPKYFTEVVKYIHNNPVKAGIVHNFCKYPWSSGKYYLDAQLYFLATDFLKADLSDRAFLELMQSPAEYGEQIMACRWPERASDFEILAAARNAMKTIAMDTLNAGTGTGLAEEVLFRIINTLIKIKGAAKTQIAKVLDVSIYKINKAIASHIQEDAQLAPGQ